MRIRLMISSLVVLLFLLCSSTIAEQSGRCGETLSWILSDSGTMTISGSGRMWDFRNDADFFDYHPCPWGNEKDSIREVIFNSGISYIGADAFIYCRNLAKVTLSGSLKQIGNFAFFCCESLQEIILPEGLTGIGQQAFAHTNISTLCIPATVGFLDAGIAESCPNLTSVLFKKRMTGGYVIGDCPFRQCPNLKAITVEEGHNALFDDDGVLYSDCFLIQYPQGRISEQYTVHSNCKQINQFAFDMDIGYPQYLKHITLLEGVESIGSLAFHRGLQSISLPESLIEIAEEAFGYSNNLSQIQYAGSRSEWSKIKIGEYNDNLLNATLSFAKKDRLFLPASLNVIEEKAFQDMKDIIFYVPDSVTNIADNAFDSSVTIQCREGSYAHFWCEKMGIDVELIP